MIIANEVSKKQLLLLIKFQLSLLLVFFNSYFIIFPNKVKSYYVHILTVLEMITKVMTYNKP